MPARTAPLRTVFPAAAVSLLVLAVCLAYGLLALAMGQDANWDLRNYHYYNPYAFLTGRRDFDVAPAHVATFYNPLLHLPFYWLVTNAPPKAVGFVLGAVQGLNFALLLAIGWFCLEGRAARPRLLLAASAAAAGLVGAMALSEVGTTFGDNVVSLPVLGSLAILVGNARRLASGPTAGALGLAVTAGLPVGLASGLKQPTVIFAVGICAACFAVPGAFWRRFFVSFVFGLGVLAGIAATGGFWLWDMWQHFGNPLFPYFNEIFQSPMANPASYKDNRFVPGQWHEFVFFPYLFTFAGQGVSEIAFFDLRPVLVYSLFLAWPLAAWWRRRRDWAAKTATATATALPGGWAAADIVLAALAVSWVVWMALFGIWRYMLPAELLMPLAILLLLERWPLRSAGRVALAALLVLAAVVSVRPGDWGRVAWGQHYFGVMVPPLADPAGTIVLMAGHDATAYVIPEFPPETRFVRIQGWFTGPQPEPNGYDLLMQDLLRRHDGPVYILFRQQEETQTARDALAAFGLALGEGGCTELRTQLERRFANPLAFCPVARATFLEQAPRS